MDRSRRRRLRRAAQVWTLGLFVLGAVLMVAIGNNAAIERLSAIVFDLYQQIRPRHAAGAPVVVVDIDDASIAAIGQWPWPRGEVAAMVDRLGSLGAATIAFDLVFSEPDRTSLAQAAARLQEAGATVTLPASLPDNDDLLAAAFARNNVVAGFVLTNATERRLPAPKTGFAVAGHSPESYLTAFAGGLPNLPVLTEAAAGAGYFNFRPSADGIVRTVPLVAQSGGQLFSSLSVEALRTAQGAGAVMIRATGASGVSDTSSPAMTALKVGALEVPTGGAGDFRVYYSGLPDMRRIPAAQLLDAGAPAERFDGVAGGIVLVGSSAIGLRDIVATPLDPALAGVEVHAEIIDQILGQTFLTRPDWAPGAEIALAVVMTVGLIAAVLSFGPVTGALAAVTLIVACVVASWIAFVRGQLVLDPIVPGVSVLAVYIAITALLFLITDRERQFVRRAFGQYLAPSLVQRLADNPAALSLGGELRDLTILFCDIRGFTALSERLDPQELTRLLNGFFTPMTDILLKSGATIDKYVGDQIMAFWNAPLPTPDHPRRACLAVTEMLAELGEVNRRSGVDIHIGVGLNTGLSCVGNLGSEQRFSYSAIGDAVNVAARLEGLTKQYGLSVLITETTAAAAGDLALIEVDRVRVVGRSEPIAVFTICGDSAYALDPAFSSLAAAHGSMLDAYRAGRFDEAVSVLAESRSSVPPSLAKLYEVYSERLVSLRQAPPSDWNGVFTAVTK